jgi:DNA adenine methylase
MTKIKHPVIRYHGAKFRIAPWIISHLPPHRTYVEPYGGAAGVLLQKPKSESEVYNDLDREIVNVFRVLQNPETAQRLTDLLRVTPYSRDEFTLSFEASPDPVEQARRTILRAYLGFGSGGATKNTTGFRVDSGREYGTASQLWARYPDCIREFVERLQGVIIENKDALDVIDNHDREDTLFFVDPPYVHSTRQMKNGAVYRHEMTDEQHRELLEKLHSVKGMVALSGYDNEFYNDTLKDWVKLDTRARISAGRGTAVRIENLWLNPACMAHSNQPSFLDHNLT